MFIEHAKFLQTPSTVNISSVIFFFLLTQKPQYFVVCVYNRNYRFVYCNNFDFKFLPEFNIKCVAVKSGNEYNAKYHTSLVKLFTIPCSTVSIQFWSLSDYFMKLQSQFLKSNCIIVFHHVCYSDVKTFSL